MTPRCRWVRRFPGPGSPDHSSALRNWQETKKLFPSLSRNQSLLLYGRGIDSPEKTAEFLKQRDSFSPSDFIDPFLIPDMDKAVKRVGTAVRKNENILIFGDYDVDGITSIAILHIFLNRHAPGLKVSYYQPDRFTEGYGFSAEGVDAAARQGASLIITVDCGITNTEAVRYSNEKGIDVVILDHHEPHDELPAAAAVVDPKRKDFTAGFRDWAGAGVAFLFVLAMSRSFPDLFPDFKFAPYVELAAVGTVADIVPLVDGNRTIVKAGFHILDRTFNGRKGINKGLFNLRKLSQTLDKPMSSRSISFVLGPRLNAAGRVEAAREATDLLLEDDDKKLREHAVTLNELNNRRKKTQNDTYESIRKILGDPAEIPDRIIIYENEDLDEGVRGIVASKVARAYNRPVLLFTSDPASGFFTGSGRSVEGLDLYDILRKFERYYEKWGGHKQAAGLTLTKDKFDAFRKEIVQYANTAIDPELLRPTLYIDSVIGCEELSKEYTDFLGLLEPFGEMNPAPLFLLENVRILKIDTQTFGTGDNLKKFVKFEVLSHDEAFKRTLTLWDPEDFFGISSLDKLNRKELLDQRTDFVVSVSSSDRNGRTWVNANVQDLAIAGLKPGRESGGSV